jgi:molecular chaperone DnaK (HSP70)
MSKIVQIGLDFGTTNTGIAAQFEDGSIEVLKENEHQLKSFPTEIFFINRDTKFVGLKAQQEASLSGQGGRHIRWIKRALSQELDCVNIFSNTYRIADLVAIILTYAKEQVSMKYDIDWDTVKLKVGYPVVLGENKKEESRAYQRMDDALRLSGFKKWELIPEPVAVAHYYNNKFHEGSTCLIFDCGGGTTDFSYVQYVKGDTSDFNVIGIDGLTTAGGNFDQQLFLRSIAKHLGSGEEYLFMGKHLTVPSHIYQLLSRPQDAPVLKQYKYRKYVDNARKISGKQSFQNLAFAIDNLKSTYLLSKAETMKIGLSQQDSVQEIIELESRITTLANYEEFKQSSYYTLRDIETRLKDFCLNKPTPDFVVMTGGMSKHRIIHSLVSSSIEGVSPTHILREDTDAIVKGLAKIDS